MKIRPFRYLLAIAMLAGLAAPCVAQADGRKYGELLKRIPDRANLLMLVDVDGLLDSPLGVREQWREKATSRMKGDLGLPATMARIAVAAGLDLQGPDVKWRVGMAEYRDRLPDLPTLAAREGGFVEDINLAKAAWTPRDLYFITFEPRILGFVSPAERQAMSRWVDTTFIKTRPYPKGFADRAVYHAEAGSQVVLAIDLADAISAPLIKPWLAGLDGVDTKTIDTGILSRQLAGAKSAFLQVDVKETIEGTIQVDFATPIDYVKPVAKTVVLATLAEAGAEMDDLKSWRGGVEGQSIVLQGRLSPESLRRVLSLAHPPRLSPESPSLAQVPADPGAPVAAVEPTRQPGKDDVVKASQGYFRAVTDVLDGLKRQKSNSYNGMKLWYERSAKQIDELPILGVDRELLDWGSTVSRTLREMAYGINYNAQDRKYSRSTSAGYYGGYYGGNADASQEAIRQQGEATLSVGLDGKWQLLQQSISDTRRKMVEKYSVDF